MTKAKAAPRARRQPTEQGSNRRAQILEIAAHLFAAKGYAGTSMRDIGEEAGVLGGSLYHHVKSKDALFAELHNNALDQAGTRIEEAVATLDDPWEKLETACITMLEIQLDPQSLTTPLMNDFRMAPEPLRRLLIERRDAFETIFARIIAELDLPPHIDLSIYRNTLLTMLNHTTDWYRPGRLSPADIGRQVAAIMRGGKV
ncbi:TetR/AcrR family transcriptional regulator [Novosphingobium sediminicola]|uniref:AcrR family transcriptional regulator n=1 Tax=Novosphingobium sediminicola TaxID=563162 RepID=A0A7W6CJU7_9SPHN|nr:TetR/AcrR family transcriptional regulator [Novosphingobium sediminicola]MBB3957871.1 AcrR family transcriptional regulator [Novosphingobium sediminicola]